MMGQYRIGDQVFAPDQDGFAEALVLAHEQRLRPLCLCRDPGAPMYVARLFGQCHIKRMPLSGSEHAPDCGSFDPPPEFGGLSDLKDQAIRVSPEDGAVTLNLGFPLTKGGTRAAPTPGEGAHDTVKADRSSLSLLSTLYYLWDEAELTRWSPGMAGKRKWPIVRHHLLLAAEGMWAKGKHLSEHLYIPEPFSADRKEAIAARRRAAMAGLAVDASSRTRPLMILVAEVKEFGQARFGCKMVVRHCPDFPFYFDEDFKKRLFKRFEFQLEAWNAHEDSHLLVIGLFSLPPSGAARLEEASLMLTDAHWLPVSDAFEARLLERLVSEQRLFVRSLRYKPTPNHPAMAAMLQDTPIKPTALFIRPANASETFSSKLDALVAAASSKANCWIWRVADGDMPPLPPGRLRDGR